MIKMLPIYHRILSTLLLMIVNWLSSHHFLRDTSGFSISNKVLTVNQKENCHDVLLICKVMGFAWFYYCVYTFKGEYMETILQAIILVIFLRE